MNLKSKKILTTLFAIVLIALLYLGISDNVKTHATENPLSNIELGIKINPVKPNIFSGHGGRYNPLITDNEKIIDSYSYNTKKLGIKSSVTLPSKYKTPYVTSVKNQGYYSTCWAFAAIASSESSVYKETKNSNIDLSEYQLTSAVYGNKMFNDINGGMDAGGDEHDSAAALANGYGTALESKFPYPTDDYSTISTNSSVYSTHDYILKNWYAFPSNKDGNKHISLSNINAIKAGVYKYGVLLASYTDSQLTSATGQTTRPYYNPVTYGYYNDTDNENTANHSVTLVGWDDTFSRNNFTKNGNPNPPAGDGAFLIKNSWGTSYGDSGYFWISYYDKSFCNCYYYDVEKPTANKIYSYDNLRVVPVGCPYCDEEWMANVFTINDSLSESTIPSYVTLFANNPNTSWRIYAYKNPKTGNPTSGTPIDIASDSKNYIDFTNTYAGFISINFEKRFYLEKGDKLAIVVRAKEPNPSYSSFPLEYKFANYPKSYFKRVAGVSYIKTSKTNGWMDIIKTPIDGSVNSNLGNLSIKLATNTEDYKNLQDLSMTGKSFYLGGTPNYNNYSLRINYADGRYNNIKMSQCKISGFPLKKTGTNYITVTYGSKSIKIKVFGYNRVYVLGNKKTGAYYYTKNYSKAVKPPKDWKYNGVLTNLPNAGNKVYQMYSKKYGYYYTASANNVKTAKRNRFKLQGAAFYSAKNGKRVSVYRMYNPKYKGSKKLASYYLTTSKSKVNSLKKSGWRYKGVAFYGVK